MPPDTSTRPSGRRVAAWPMRPVVMLATDVNGHVIPTGREPAIAVQDVSLGAGSTQSSAFNDRTKLIRVNCDAAFRMAIGPDPTASATTARISAGATEFFGVRPGDKIAVIQSS